MIVLYINVIILCLLVITAIAINQQDNLFATTMLTGIFSLLSASLFVCLDAVDVAFTEAAVGAGIALILFLGALSLIKYKEKNKNEISFLGFYIKFYYSWINIKNRICTNVFYNQKIQFYLTKWIF